MGNCLYMLRGLDSNQEYPAPKAGVLPLNDPASYGHTTYQFIFERRTGIGPVTFSLARRHSTGELPPRHGQGNYVSLPTSLPTYVSQGVYTYCTPLRRYYTQIFYSCLIRVINKLLYVQRTGVEPV